MDELLKTIHNARWFHSAIDATPWTLLVLLQVSIFSFLSRSRRRRCWQATTSDDTDFMALQFVFVLHCITLVFTYRYGGFASAVAFSVSSWLAIGICIMFVSNDTVVMGAVMPALLAVWGTVFIVAGLRPELISNRFAKMKFPKLSARLQQQTQGP